MRSDRTVRWPITEAHPVWHAVLDELAQVLTAGNFNRWPFPTRAVSQERNRAGGGSCRVQQDLAGEQAARPRDGHVGAAGVWDLADVVCRGNCGVIDDETGKHGACRIRLWRPVTIDNLSWLLV